jgi:hypothetical protein
MKVALPSRIGPPLPSAQVCERVAVGPLARKFPLLPAPYQAKAPPPTQVVRPEFFDNKNEFYAPLVQVVPTTERMLSDKVTSAELKHVLEANAKALRHGGKPTTLGYGTDWATIQERAAKKLRTKRESLDTEKKNAAKKRRQDWQRQAEEIWRLEPDLTREEVAGRIEKDPHRHEDDVGKASWIRRHIRKK